MDFNVFVLALAKQFCFLAVDIFISIKILSLYRSISQNSLFKKLLTVWVASLIGDFFGVVLIVYKANYRFFISEVPQPLYLFLARFHYVLWPLVIFLMTLFWDWIVAAEGKLQKRHYVLGAWAISLSIYFVYYFCIQEPDPTNSWLTLHSLGFVLGDIFIFISRGSTLIYGIKRLVVGQVPGIIKQQTKSILILIAIPTMILQPFWILQLYGVIPTNGFGPELFGFVLSILCLVCVCYAYLALFRLRLFNACPAVHAGRKLDVMRPLAQVARQIREATTLQEIYVLTTAYFEKAFGFVLSEVNLYIRSTQHERNIEAARSVRTLPNVEELFGSKEKSLLCEKIRKKKILLHAEVQYEELYNLDAEAKELRVFLEANNAEVLLPIFGKKELVGYIIIERNARMGRLVSDEEVHGMLLYADHISYVIENMQQFNAEIIEKECVMYKRQNYQLFQEQQLYLEGMHSVVQGHASEEAVSVIFSKNNRLHLASSGGAKLLGLPEGTKIVNDSYELPVKQLIHDFKRFKRENAILLKDGQGNPVRFSVMRDSRQSNAIVVVSRPSISEVFRVPTFADVRDREDWSYAIFLQTTEAGRLLEKFIPATQGILFDFKIKFLRAVLCRQPIFLQGVEEDVQRLAVLAQRICARADFQEISPRQPETNREIASQIFGVPAVIAGEAYKGALENLSASGVLFINHIERLSLESQEFLAKFFATGTYTSFFSRQLTSSDAIVLCGSSLTLKELADTDTFAKSFYNELEKNYVEIPELATLPQDQFDDLVSRISSQILKEFSGTINESQVVEEITKGASPNSICELRQRINNIIEQRSSQQKLVEESLDANLENFDSVITESRRQGRATLKNKPLFYALVTLVKSYARIAEILDVDYSTVCRTCHKYQVGSFAPGVQRKPGRPRTKTTVISVGVPCS